MCSNFNDFVIIWNAACMVWKEYSNFTLFIDFNFRNMYQHNCNSVTVISRIDDLEAPFRKTKMEHFCV